MSLNNEYKTDVLKATEENIIRAAELIKKGEVVGMPTETVYGLAANAFDEKAVKKIFYAKGRPQDNPLILHICRLDMIENIAEEFCPLAQKCAEKFWPGPFTMILPKSKKLTTSVTGGLDTVAIRMPDHKTALELIDKSNCPIAAPSANISGSPSPTTARHVFNDMNGRIPLILDGGSCNIGVESTVVKIEKDKITLLRPGAVTLEQLREICPNTVVSKGVTDMLEKNQKAESPGMKYKHYAPKVKMALVHSSAEAFAEFAKKKADGQNIGVLVFDEEYEDFVSMGFKTASYGRKDNALDQANHLFDVLRSLDNLGVDEVYARMPDKSGVGLAVYNRMIRAAGFEIIEL